MKIRMFLSIPVKEPEKMRPVLEYVGGMRNVRASPISQMHMTVRFIGDIDDGKVKKVAKAISDAVADEEPFTIKVGGAGCFPKKEHPTVLWIGAEPKDRLERISHLISENLRDSNISFDSKPFKAHITVGRCNGSVDIDGFLGNLDFSEITSFVCDEILVMRSDLSSKGAVHTVLQRVPLGKARGTNAA